MNASQRFWHQVRDERVKIRRAERREAERRMPTELAERVQCFAESHHVNQAEAARILIEAGLAALEDGC